MSDHIITCVYCGQAYPENTPTHGADVKVLTEHIKVCPKHPMSSLVKELAECKAAMQDVVNAWKFYVNNPGAPIAGMFRMGACVEKCLELCERS